MCYATAYPILQIADLARIPGVVVVARPKGIPLLHAENYGREAVFAEVYRLPGFDDAHDAVLNVLNSAHPVTHDGP